MATIPYIEILLGFVCLLFFAFRRIRNRNSAPLIIWPVLGMLPELLWNLQRVNDFATELLQLSAGTFEFKGPWFCNLDFVCTSDPVNTHHILSRGFSNYTKGQEFGMIFEPSFGDGILAADFDSWKFQRKLIHSYLKKFQLFLERTVRDKVVRSLIPVLDHACIHKIEVDLEDVFLRFGFDIVCLSFLGRDPKCLSIEFLEDPFVKAIIDMEEATVNRFVFPDKLWKLQKWLQIGKEKKLSTGAKILDDFVYKCISSKREKYLESKTEIKQNSQEEMSFDFLTAFLLREDAWIKEGNAGALWEPDDKFLRDVATNLVLAGRDTSSAALSWFFYLLATNKEIERKILQEIKDNLLHKEYVKQVYIFSVEELNKLVYLHAALCETLRLYPPVSFNLKCPVKPDTLPSGLHVKENTKIFISFYAMGRMEGIWGKDCYEFKPERWISRKGGLLQVPSYKFTAFSAGPRTCLGKDMSFAQMKIVAVAIILNYQIQLVEDHPVVPNTSIVLHMKHGLKVRVTKRCV